VKLAFLFTNQLGKLHNGNYARYLIWSLLGVILVIIFLAHSI